MLFKGTITRLNYTTKRQVQRLAKNAFEASNKSTRLNYFHDNSVAPEENFKLSDHRFAISHFVTEKSKTSSQQMLAPWQKKGEPPAASFSCLHWNILKQCRKTAHGYNNGFGIVETKEDYIERLSQIGIFIRQLVKEREANGASPISIGCLEEAPITEEGKKALMDGINQGDSKYKIIDSTAWGILTFVDPTLVPAIFKVHGPSTNTESQIDTRIAEFEFKVANECSAHLFNVHLPHPDTEADAEKTQDALNVVSDKFVANLMNSILKGRLNDTQILVGDWNLDPEDVNAAVEERLNDLFGELGVHSSVHIAYGEKGHRKEQGEDITVDASVCVHYSIPPDLLKMAQDQVQSYIEEKEAEHDRAQKKSTEKTSDPVFQETKPQMAMDNLSAATLKKYREHHQLSMLIPAKESVSHFKKQMQEMGGKDDESPAASIEKKGILP